MDNKRYKATIFDFDGVIVDSESLGIAASQEVLRNDFGLDLDAEDRRAFYGLHDHTYYRRLKAKYGLNHSALELLDRHNAVYGERLRQIEGPLPGIRRLVGCLCAQDHPLAICSGSQRHQIMSVLDRIQLREAFEVVVAAEDTRNHKPHPGPYLATAEKLGVSPYDCRVFEDSECGVLAAKSAGMSCIGVEIGSQGTQDLRKADGILRSLEELPLPVSQARWPSPVFSR